MFKAKPICIGHTLLKETGSLAFKTTVNYNNVPFLYVAFFLPSKINIYFEACSILSTSFASTIAKNIYLAL
jgi:hypothetical protein